MVHQDSVYLRSFDELGRRAKFVTINNLYQVTKTAVGELEKLVISDSISSIYSFFPDDRLYADVRAQRQEMINQYYSSNLDVYDLLSEIPIIRIDPFYMSSKA